MEVYTRQCPKCSIIVEHSSKYNRNSAQKNNILCRHCSSKNRCEKFGSYIDVINERVSKGLDTNPFLGKKHSQKSKDRMSESHKQNSHLYKTEEFRKKMSLVTSGEKNGMYGKSVIDAWIQRYGEEEAQIRYESWKKSISKGTAGEKNPMYGKPAPQGSGNGWSGHYKNWYFRSLLELSYMVKIIERFNLNWKSAEIAEYKINYVDYKGLNRTYTADFIINDKYLVEIKPDKLKSSPSNLKKIEAAKQWCNDRNLTYKITNCSKLTDSEIKELVDQGKIVFLHRYKKKYEQHYETNKRIDPS